MNIALLLSFFVALYVIRRIVDHFRVVRSIGNHPGYRTLLSQWSILSTFLPPIPGISSGRNHFFRHKYQMFEHHNWDVLTAVSAWPQSKAALVLAGASPIKEVLVSRSRFPKPVHMYRVLLSFGRNIIASEGQEWKKYRKVAAPAFSDRNNKLVWDETVSIVDDMFKNVWGNQPTITTDHCVEIALPIALFVIGVAGFGHKMSWQDDTVRKPPTGHQMTFKDALHNVAADVFLKAVVPDAALGLTKRTRAIKLAFNELRQYMSEMIRDRQSSKKSERYDLFSSLLDANNADFDEEKLTESELIGNIFLFLISGHESTAHTMCFALALLALYQDEQETLYKHIKSVLTDGRLPTYDDMNLLAHSMAVYYETLRMFPPVTAIPKESVEDTFLTATNNLGEKKRIPVLKGTNIVIDIVALHYNPRYWEDPDTFKPARFLGDWPREAFLPFSAGARACLGRKFFETEGIAVLTMIISRYKVEVKEEPQFASETFQARRDRILACKAGLTLTPTRMPLVFKLRKVDHMNAR